MSVKGVRIKLTKYQFNSLSLQKNVCDFTKIFSNKCYSGKNPSRQGQFSKRNNQLIIQRVKNWFYTQQKIYKFYWISILGLFSSKNPG